MTKLEIGEFLTVLAPMVDYRKAFGFSFIDVDGKRETYWVIRDHNGVFQGYGRGVCLSGK